MSDAEEAQQKDEPNKLAVGFVVLLLGAALVGLVLLFKGLYPDSLPIDNDPDFIDNIFDSQLVVFFARLLLVSFAFVLAVGGLFIVVSTFVRMGNREWLRRAGPFEVSETAIEELQAQIDFWRTAALESSEETETLRTRLEESDSTLQQIADMIDHLDETAEGANDGDDEETGDSGSG